MMAAFYVGCGLSLAAAGFAPEPYDDGGRHVRVGMFAASSSVGYGNADRSTKARGRSLAFTECAAISASRSLRDISAALATWLGWVPLSTCRPCSLF